MDTRTVEQHSASDPRGPRIDSVLVAGGTGTLGSVLVPRLVERALPVRVLTRTADELVTPGVEVLVGDIGSPADAARAVRGVRTVVSAVTGFGPARGVTTRGVDLEGNRTLFAAAREAGVEHIVLLSVRGAAPDHPIELFRMKFAAEQALRASGLAWTIVRPSAYLETWVALLCDPLAGGGSTRVFGRGDNPINFVSVREVAKVAERAVVDPALRGETIEVTGPEDLSMNELLQRSRTDTTAPGKVAHVPRSGLRVASFALRPINPCRAALIRAALVMDTWDMTAPPHPPEHER